MNILVTGGAGYVGSSLVEKLNDIEEVKSIYVLDNLSQSPLAFFLGAKKLEKVIFIKGDILDSYILDKLMGKVEVVFHLAAYVSSPYNYSQNVQYEQINQWGTLNLVRCIQQAQHKISKFIYLSSASVYGLNGIVKLPAEPQPTNSYGKSKLEGEKFVSLLKDTCQVNILRSANIFGFNNSLRMDSVLNNFIFHGIVDKKIMIYGSGTQQRPFVSLENVIGSLLSILSENRKSELIIHAVEFNASLLELKDWLIQRHLPNLEYTFINPNIVYEEQYITGFKSIEGVFPTLDSTFVHFKDSIRINNIN